METFWILPLYFISPAIGVILLVWGIVRYKKSKRKNRILVGAILLSLPLLHSLSMRFLKKNYSNDLVGNYAIEGRTETILALKENGRFVLKETEEIRKNGNGNWNVNWGDDVQLELHFKNDQESELSFQITEEDDTIRLHYDSSVFKVELLKK